MLRKIVLILLPLITLPLCFFLGFFFTFRVHLIPIKDCYETTFLANGAEIIVVAPTCNWFDISLYVFPLIVIFVTSILLCLFMFWVFSPEGIAKQVFRKGLVIHMTYLLFFHILVMCLIMLFIWPGLGFNKVPVDDVWN